MGSFAASRKITLHFRRHLLLPRFPARHCSTRIPEANVSSSVRPQTPEGPRTLQAGRTVIQGKGRAASYGCQCLEPSVGNTFRASPTCSAEFKQLLSAQALAHARRQLNPLNSERTQSEGIRSMLAATGKESAHHTAGIRTLGATAGQMPLTRAVHPGRGATLSQTTEGKFSGGRLIIGGGGTGGRTLFPSPDISGAQSFRGRNSRVKGRCRSCP